MVDRDDGRGGRAQPARLPAAELARAVRDVLGPDLAAEAAGATDAGTLDGWAAGTLTPDAEAVITLRHADEVVRLLLEREEPETVRAWFGGMNPELDDRSPASLLPTDFAAVVGAARAFLAG